MVGRSALTSTLLAGMRTGLQPSRNNAGSYSQPKAYGPSRRNAKWRWVTWGSIVAALLWMAASMVFSWYVATFDSYNRVYGSLGAGIGFMVWLWISAVIVLQGGEVNAEREHQPARDSTDGERRPLGP